MHVLVYLRVVHNVFDVVSFGFVFSLSFVFFFVFSCSVVYLCVLSGAVSGYGFCSFAVVGWVLLFVFVFVLVANGLSQLSCPSVLFMQWVWSSLCVF